MLFCSLDHRFYINISNTTHLTSTSSLLHQERPLVSSFSCCSLWSMQCITTIDRGIPWSCSSPPLLHPLSWKSWCWYSITWYLIRLITEFKTRSISVNLCLPLKLNQTEREFLFNRSLRLMAILLFFSFLFFSRSKWVLASSSLNSKTVRKNRFSRIRKQYKIPMLIEK